MLAPSVDGARERHSLWPLCALLAGGILGGLVLGAGMGATSMLLSNAPHARVGIGSGMILLAALGAGAHPTPWWIPQRACQVNGHRLVAQPVVRASFGWGLELGLGVRTFVVTPAFYGVLALGIAAEQPLVAVSTGVIYGGARVATIAGFSRIVRRFQALGLESKEPGQGIARRTRGLVALATALAGIALVSIL